MNKQSNNIDEEQLEHIRHSLAHVLAAAMLKDFPNAKFGIGPVIEDGFYYDFDIDKQITPSDLTKIEKTMREIIAQKLPFTRKEVTAEEAEKIFKDQPLKLELIKELKDKGEKISIYIIGDENPEKSTFVDLCRGGHIENTSEIPADAFKLDKIAGAYWRGDEKNKMLQRIYGVAFATKKELEDYYEFIEEAKKRDHRKLGKELGLFMVSEEVGLGLPLFYPKGAILRRNIEDYITNLQESRGYVPIWVPHITKGELYKISGHLDKYDAMYPPMDLKDEAKYYIKPMNCPHFMILYRSIPHSYRDLPVRYTCTTTVYRHEKSGELSGLTRVRALTQDDCHVFAMPNQIEQEINLMLDMIAEVYKTFGFNDFWVRISTHDPKDKDKYIGDPKIWEDSETILTDLIQKRGWKHDIGVGEAAFYGPKLDFIFKDAIGRDWQLSTIQLDMNLPQRFELEYVDEKSEKQRPVVIHRAILGSTERFMGILIEHFAGAFPAWLAPVQVTVIPVSEKTLKYAEEIFAKLKQHNIRTEFSEPNESLGKRIREAEMMKVPYIIVVGEKEEREDMVNVRARNKNKESEEVEMKTEKFIEKIEREIRERTL
jgi:threonyl-tRNA synthetase